MLTAYGVGGEIFLSTYPVRGTTSELYADSKEEIFLSTYPVRGTTEFGEFVDNDPNISIHVPRAGYDVGLPRQYGAMIKFLSTYPVRGTTVQLGTLLF